MVLVNGQLLLGDRRAPARADVFSVGGNLKLANLEGGNNFSGGKTNVLQGLATVAIRSGARARAIARKN